MKTNLDKISSTKVKIKVEIEPGEFQAFSDRAYEKIAPTVNIKGFRPGKAPKLMILEAIGQQRLLSQALDLAITETYPKAIKELGVNPVSQPALTILEYPNLSVIQVPGQNPAKANKFVYQIEFDILPAPVIGDLAKIRIKDKNLINPKIEISDDEINKVLITLQKRQAVFEEKNGLCEKGDRIVIDFTGKIDNVPQENLTSKNYPVILGEGVLIAAFEKEIIGMKKDENKVFKVNIPINSSKTLKEVEFDVKVGQVQKVILPILNDSLALKFGQKNLKELKEKISESIRLEKENKAKNDLENHVLQQALMLLKVEIPESLILKESEKIKQNFTDNLQKQGLSIDQYLNMIKRKPEELEKSFNTQAQDSIKVGLLLGEVAKKEKIDPQSPDSAKQAMEKLVSYAK